MKKVYVKSVETWIVSVTYRSDDRVPLECRLVQLLSLRAVDPSHDALNIFTLQSPHHWISHASENRILLFICFIIHFFNFTCLHYCCGVRPRACAVRSADALSFAKHTERLIDVNKTYINLTQHSFARRRRLPPSLPLSPIKVAGKKETGDAFLSSPFVHQCICLWVQIDCNIQI